MTANEKLLIVEDEKIIAADLRRRLEKFGYEIVGLASNYAETLQYCEKDRPDLVLMDIMIRGEKDGIDTAIHLRKTMGIPVVFITAYADPATLNRAKEADPLGYILKPFREKELFTTLDIALYKSGMDRRLKNREHWFQTILQSTSEGIIATDEANAISFMNPAAENLTGWKADEAVGRELGVVLQLVEERTGKPVRIPTLVDRRGSREHMKINKALLKTKQGAAFPIEGTSAVIRDSADGRQGDVIVFHDMSNVREMSDLLSYQASHDLLTDLPNRDEFSERLVQLLETSRKTSTEHALVFFDLDQFKLINDTCGHIAGDELLKKIALVLRSEVRDTDTCARLGGDEFGVLLENCPLSKAMEIADKIGRAIGRIRFVWDEHIYTVTASTGLVSINEQSKDLNSILAAADDACYLAKEEGGNRLKVYENRDLTFLKRRGEMHWIYRLSEAMERNQFLLYVQPIRPVVPGSFRPKAEILLRMKGDEGGIVMPIDFLPAAERYNLMPLIDRWVVNTAFRVLSDPKCRTSVVADIFTINLSGASVADEQLSRFILDAAEANQIDPKRICFEITETAAIANLSKATVFMDGLRRYGYTFSLDDFGRGFSSLSYLKTLPVDYLKIDGVFVKSICEDEISKAMVEAINKLGHLMGIRTIAEFVATPDILPCLEELGVDYAQGYAIAAPVPLVLTD